MGDLLITERMFVAGEEPAGETVNVHITSPRGLNP